MGLPIKRLIALGASASAVAVAGSLCSDGNVAGALASVVSGVLTNFLASSPKPDEQTPESLVRNHDLRQLIGIAIRDCILLETEDVAAAKKLAGGAVALWMSEASIADTSLAPLGEQEATAYFATDQINFDTQTALDVPTWRTFLSTLAETTSTTMSDELRMRIAMTIHMRLPQMLRGVVKQDFTGKTESEGRGFASLQLVMLGKMMAGIDQLLATTQRPSNELLEQLKQFNARAPEAVARHDGRIKDPRERATMNRLADQINSLRPHLDKRLDELSRVVVTEGVKTRKEVKGVDRKVVYVLAGIGFLGVAGLVGWQTLMKTTTKSISDLTSRLDESESLIKQFLAERPLDANNQPIIPQLTGDMKTRAEELIAKGNKRQRLTAAVVMNDFTTADRLQKEIRAQNRAERDAEDFDLAMLEGDRWYRANDPDKSIEPYETALKLKPSDLLARNNVTIARAFARRGDISAHRLRSIEVATGTLALLPPDSSNWGTTQTNIGNAWQYLPTGNIAENMNKAIAAYNASMTVNTREAHPREWSLAQNNLGNAYLSLPTGDPAENYGKAIKAYEAALTVRTPQEYPVDWAMTQANLGLAYAYLPTADKDVNTGKAIKAYEAAATVYTRAKHPAEWSAVQQNLGNAYTALTSGDRAANFKKAMAAYEAAMTVRTAAAAPSDWAMTQMNVANAWLYMPTGERGENIKKAIAAYDASLTIYVRSAFPAEWAMTQYNKGLAFADLAELPDEDKAARLRQAIACDKAALQVYTPADFPNDHANTTKSLGFHRVAYESIKTPGLPTIDTIRPVE